MNSHVMTDLETLDNVPTSVIISIGATIFHGPRSGDTFYKVVDRQSCEDAGLTVSAETVAWWDKQSPEARKIFDEPSEHIISALMAFSDWLPCDCKLWRIV